MDSKGDTLISASPVSLKSDAGLGVRNPSQYLILMSGGPTGAMLPLTEGANWIGRAPENAIQLHEPSVSRQHAVLEVKVGQGARISDLNSSNGTFLNGQRLLPREPYPIQDGDRLRLGPRCLLKYALPAPCEEQAQRELYERSVRDGLTGLFNRNYFFEQLGQLAHEAQELGLGLAMVMIDLDHFKQVNDQFGHEGGDTVLRETAAALRQASRPHDLVARYGGEEFVLALPCPSQSQAEQRAERIRRLIARRPLRLGNDTIGVTASVGVAFAPADRPRAPEALVSLADLRLYRAKEQGRNCVVSSDPPSPPLHQVQLTTDGEVPLAT